MLRAGVTLGVTRAPWLGGSGKGWGGVGARDDAGEAEGMGWVAGDLVGECTRFVVPAEDDGAPPQARQDGCAREQDVDQRPPRVEQHHHCRKGEEHEQARDGRIELQHERQAEIGHQPDRGALQDRIEILVTTQEQARVVQSELHKRRHEQRDADQQQGQVARKRGIRHIQTDAAHGGFVA